MIVILNNTNTVAQAIHIKLNAIALTLSTQQAHLDAIFALLQASICCNYPFAILSIITMFIMLSTTYRARHKVDRIFSRLWTILTTVLALCGLCLVIVLCFYLSPFPFRLFLSTIINYTISMFLTTT